MSILWLLKFVGGPLLIVALLGGGYAFVTHRAYERGYAKGWADNTAAQVKVIEEKQQNATDNRGKIDRRPDTEIDTELRARCRAACAEDKQCAARC